MINCSKIASALLVGSLLWAPAFAAKYKMTSGGSINNPNNWRPNVDVTTDLTAEDVLVVDGLSANFGKNADGMGGATLNALNGAELTVGKVGVSNVILNVESNSTVLFTSSSSKIGKEFILNYNSSAISISEGNLKVGSDTTRVYLNNGGLQLGTLTTTSGGVITLNGGDLSFADYSFQTGRNKKPGSINFISGAGSIMAYTEASAVTDLDPFITDGFISIDGVAKTIEDFRRSYDGGTLILALSGAYVDIPEPRTYVLFAGLTALGFIAMRRRKPCI